MSAVAEPAGWCPKSDPEFPIDHGLIGRACPLCGWVRLVNWSDDRHGMMRVHVADERARLAAAKHASDTLRAWANQHDVTLRKSLNKRDLAWYMAQHGLIDAEGNLREGFPGSPS